MLILALGGLLVPVLTKAGYAERFSIGLATCAGSAGLLLPPSLALILFAVVAQISILDLFVASLLPAGIMILGIAAFRFEKPLGEVIVSVLPILGVMLVFVLAITYLPLVVPFPGF